VEPVGDLALFPRFHGFVFFVIASYLSEMRRSNWAYSCISLIIYWIKKGVGDQKYEAALRALVSIDFCHPEYRILANTLGFLSGWSTSCRRKRKKKKQEAETRNS